MNFKEYFNKLKFYQKIELYLLVVMIYGFVLYQYNSSSKYSTNKIEVKKDISFFKDKLEKKNRLFFIQYIEENLKRYDLVANSINFKQNKLILNIDGKFSKLIRFITAIEQHIIINKIDFKKDDNTLNLVLICEVKYFYNSKSFHSVEQNIPNCFLDIKQPKVEANITKTSKLILQGIIDNTIVLNGKFYNIGDSVDGYKIIKIFSNYIILNHQDKNKTVRLFDEK